jgi:dUTP pyrophosphatase
MTGKILLADPRCLPVYSTEGAAGMDLKAYINETITLPSMGRVKLRTGVSMEIPEGMEGNIRPRSGLFVQGLFTTGTIDSDYRGEIMLTLVNLSAVPITIKPFDRVAQMVVSPFVRVQFDVSEYLSETERGTGGHGSTGVSSHYGC